MTAVGKRGVVSVPTAFVLILKGSHALARHDAHSDHNMDDRSNARRLLRSNAQPRETYNNEEVTPCMRNASSLDVPC
jgi:hypothetical protein